MVRTCSVSLLLVLVVRCASGAEPPAAKDDHQLFQEARELEEQGQPREAFLKYLKVAGAESAAARVARENPREYLKLLEESAAAVPAGRLQLLKGDLVLAHGRKDEALAAYRTANEWLIKRLADAGRKLGELPAYWVEATGEGAAYGPAQPFTFGPGSHRDNWVIRRFIGLEAWDDAGREFARLWAIHRERTRPYVTWHWVTSVERPAAEQLHALPPSTPQPNKRYLVQPAGFDSMGLQFAMDYAFFLKRQKRLDEALAVLKEPLLQVDMDRNPNNSGLGEFLADDRKVDAPERPSSWGHRRRFHWWGGSAGFSRKEFIRLAFGEFKAAGREDELVRAIQKQIDDGENRVRRVLARIRLHQGKLDEALALELAYIGGGKFDEFTAAYRRGMAFDDGKRLAEAADEYEKALKLPCRAPALPDKDEETRENQQMSSMAIRQVDLAGPGGEAFVRQDLTERFRRVCAALSQPERALPIVLKRHELTADLAASESELTAAARQFEAAGKRDQFVAWVREMSAKAEDPLARANLFWMLGEHAACAKAAAEACRDGRCSADTFRGRFEALGRDQLRVFLREVVQRNPKDGRSRLELLDVEDRFEGPEVVRALEALLDDEATPNAFVQGKGAYNRTRFRNYFDLANRLLCLYEQDGQSEDRLLQLGFRILEGEKPFGMKGSDGRNILSGYRADWNGFAWSSQAGALDALQCLLSFAAHLKRPEDIARAARLAEAAGSLPLVNQIAKLRPETRGLRRDPAASVQKQYPKGVSVRTLGRPGWCERLLTNRDDVRSVSPDGNWVGTSWGLVRYTEKAGALEVLQVPIGARVAGFCQTPSGLFVGTWDGVYRLDDADAAEPRLARLDLAEALAEGGRGGRAEPREARVGQLLWFRDRLWVAVNGKVLLYDPAAQTVQNYGERPGPLFTGLGRLWCADGYYDAAADRFESLEPGFRQWRLIGATAREVWADVYVNDELRHRPALLDAKTLKLRVLPVVNLKRPAGEPMINGDCSLVAEDADRAWLMGHYSHLLRYDRAADELRFVSAYGQPARGAAGGGPAVWYTGDTSGGPAFLRLDCGTGAMSGLPGLDLRGDRGPYYCYRELPGGGLRMGAAIVREWWEDNLGYDDNDGMSHHIQDLEGGLFEVDPKTLKWRKLGARAEELTDFYVKKIVLDDKERRAWVCTNGGLTVLSLPGCEVTGRITVSDGLPANKVEDAVRIGEKLYLACELGDAGGGLAVVDLPTGLVRVMSSLDGLECDKVKALRADGARLHILYGEIYAGRSRLKPGGRCVEMTDNTLSFKSSILDTATGRLSQGEEVLRSQRDRNGAGGRGGRDKLPRLPLLGGTELCRVEAAGLVIRGGSHGLVVSRVGAGGTDEAVWPAQAVKRVESLADRQRAEAERLGRGPADLAGVRQWIASPNPYVRVRALEHARVAVKASAAEWVEALAPLAGDPHAPVRFCAARLLAGLDAPEAQPLLEKLFGDDRENVKLAAAIGLARLGKAPDLGYFDGVFAQYGSQYFAERQEVMLALARHADAPVFALLARHPHNDKDSQLGSQTFKGLGAALRASPDAAEALLKTYDTEAGGAHATFVRLVFEHAGKELLPRLHRALAGPDRVVRANAALACGALGDASSVEPLIAALGLESGLSRRAIVRALGELKAHAALPAMAKLYVDAVNDEKRRQGSGFRAAQVQAEVAAQYTTLSNLDAMGQEWSELKESALPKPVDPHRNERLLCPGDILETVRKVGPEASQEFYRTLAGSREEEGRLEAARRLAEGGPGEEARNLPILRNLLADRSEHIGISAAVSLLILGEDDVRAQVLGFLKDSKEWATWYTVRELSERVQDGKRLAFAKEALRRLAQAGNRQQQAIVSALLGRIP